MSEELRQTSPIRIGKYLYYRLGQTTVAQLKKARIITSPIQNFNNIKSKKPDGVITLEDGSVKAIIEYKDVGKLKTESQIEDAKKEGLEIARNMCKLLIVSDGQTTFWINSLTECEITKNGRKINFVFDAQKIVSQTMTPEERYELENLLDEAEQFLSENNDNIQDIQVIDPTPLAKRVWQKIWINTGKEPEKCLYNVVEIFVFKFLSDIGVLQGDSSFEKVYRKKEEEGSESALEYYAKNCRPEIKKMFPAGEDNTTIINGTIFVNEQGDANLSQALLFGEVIEEFMNFSREYGSFRYVTKEFKTRLYETFLRQSAGVKSLGQYFTPRNVVQAMVDMSDAKFLQDGAKICDPFCGVGGFILETIIRNQNIYSQFIPRNGTVEPKITLVGYDKGTDEKDDERTIILAKANMLIYFSDLLAKYNSSNYLKEYAEKAINKVFKLIRTNLGTFGIIEENQYDLILTNPPYVTSGTSSLKNALAREGLEGEYKMKGRGTESLAIEWIIRALKPGGQALVIVPNGLLVQHDVLKFIKEKCFIEGVVSLPTRTFYATPKKTYILVIRKKPKELQSMVQQEPVFLYLVTEIGESRDARRELIEQNDLKGMVELFYLFKVKQYNNIHSPRCKIYDFSEFDKLANWLIDKNCWSEEEKIALNIKEEAEELTEEEFFAYLREINFTIESFLNEVNENEY